MPTTKHKMGGFKLIRYCSCKSLSSEFIPQFSVRTVWILQKKKNSEISFTLNSFFAFDIWQISLGETGLCFMEPLQTKQADCRKDLCETQAHFTSQELFWGTWLQRTQSPCIAALVKIYEKKQTKIPCQELIILQNFQITMLTGWCKELLSTSFISLCTIGWYLQPKSCWQLNSATRKLRNF
jgi:hypothetical protein